MNNKLLIFALITLLSGCATHNTTPTLVTGIGGGSVGAEQNSANKAASTQVYPTYPAKPSVVTSITDKEIAPTAPKTIQPIYPDQDSALKPKHDALESIDVQKNTEVLNKPPVVINMTDKNILSPAPKIIQPIYPDQNSAVKPKRDALENIDVQKNTEVLNKPSLNRYTNNKNKNISSGAPASNNSAGNPSNYVISGESYKVLPFSHGFAERGIASWYGPDFHGEKTSNGEKYNMYAMTAAHKRLPIPSYVRVTNLKNKRNVVLRINDRGPFYADRVIDLSYTAAQKLDIHQPGTEMVQIEAIKTNKKERVYLQLGVFSSLANAQMLQKKVVENKMPQPIVKEVQVNGKLAYRVQLGPIFSVAKVNEFNAKLAKMGISETWYLTENKVN